MFTAKAGRYRRPGADRLRLAHHQGHRGQGRQSAKLRRGQGRDREGPQAAEGGEEVRGGGRPVPEPRLRTGGFAAARGEGTQSAGADHAARSRAPQVQALGQGNAKFAQAVFSPESLQSKAQYRSDRSRAQHACCGAGGRLQGGDAAAASTTSRRKFASNSSSRRRAISPRRPARKSSRCCNRARTLASRLANRFR